MAFSGRGAIYLILETIKNKLKEIDPSVDYGTVDNSRMESAWNYIVFDRKIMRTNTNKTGYSYYFSVHVIRENFIPEGLEIKIIEKMEEIAGMRFAGNDIQYTYTNKPNTNMVIEMASIDFVRPVKA